jgi:hypothetical protein
MSQATDGHSTASAVLPATSRRSQLGAGAALLMADDAVTPPHSGPQAAQPVVPRPLLATSRRHARH